MRFILGIVVFLFLNFLLWGVQELYYLDETREINKIEEYLEKETTQLTLIEDELLKLEFELDTKKSLMDNYLEFGNTTLYDLSIESFNSKLDDYLEKFDKYEERTSDYNEKVEELNQLYKESSSRWYLIPLPRGSGGRNYNKRIN